LFFYDALVTFDREMACFWTAKWTGGPLLFLANKWISMLYYVVALNNDCRLTIALRSCSSFVMVQQAVQALQFIPGAVFSALRAYVLSKSKLLGILVFALSLAPVGVNLVKYGYHISGANLPPFGCLGTDNETEALSVKHCTVIAVSRVPLIVTDLLLVYITWAKTSSRSTLRDMRQSKRLSLSDILIRDGTVYFLVLFILNILHLVLSVTAVMRIAGLMLVHSPFCSLTAILISRFLLDLQEANQTVVRLDSDDPLHSSRDPWDDTPNFISSFGAYINSDLPARPNDDLGWDVASHPKGEGSSVETSQLEATASSLSSPSSTCSVSISASV
ncbi:hypothetical protein C8T65DRAFT_582330, partial [Cerioporus squamosus]